MSMIEAPEAEPPNTSFPSLAGSTFVELEQA
jgi:hypothetical protein